MQPALFNIPRVFKQKAKTNIISKSAKTFYDYNAFVQKFNEEAPKTTDDCYTPEPLFQIVLDYVASQYDLHDKQIIRPFYPGGDYLNYTYPTNGVVIDNPPFSIFTEICKFYASNQIPFFLFGPGLTIGQVFDICTVIVINHSLPFANGAKVRINFASNLFGDLVLKTAPELDEAIREYNRTSSDTKQKKEYPAEVLSISHAQRICRNGWHLEVKRSECQVLTKLNGNDLFGKHLLVSSKKACEKQRKLYSARNAESENKTIYMQLSKEEKKLVEQLDNNGNS